MIKKKREVYITENLFVMYISRNKFQHHSAAQFDKTVYDIEFVKAWVKNQHDLILVEKPKE